MVPAKASSSESTNPTSRSVPLPSASDLLGGSRVGAPSARLAESSGAAPGTDWVMPPMRRV